MKFFNESYHLNQDYIYFAADSGTFSTNALQYSIKATKSGPPAVSFSENTARFLLPDAGMTRLSVFDCFGREILRPANRRMQAGNNSMKVNVFPGP
jgi:hypothetical protein